MRGSGRSRERRGSLWLGAVAAAVVVAGTGVPLDPARAVETSIWEVRGSSELGATETEKVSINALGVAELAPRLELAFEPGDNYVWSLAAAKDGSAYGGTGDGGLVIRVPRRGEGETIHDSIELEITAIVVGPDGAVYAGGAPDGVVIRIADGEARTFFDSPESYIWAMAFGEDGDLYAATGDRGRLYRITPDGEGTIYYDSNEVHLLSLLPAETSGHWLVGTSSSGLVLEVIGEDQARVIYDCPEEDVKSLFRDRLGNLYFSATGGEPADEENHDPLSTTIEITPKENESSSNGPRPRAAIYRQIPGGAVTRFWRSPESMILALASDGAGGLLVGTGGEGAIYRLDGRGTAALLVKTEEAQVLALRRTEHAVLVGTGNPGRVYRFGPDVETEGSLKSQAFDAGNVAAWGRLSFAGERPSGTRIELRTRTGNTATPDETWSEWSLPIIEPDGAAISSPRARFIQWEARLVGSGNRSPRLTAVTVPYLQENLPPHIYLIDVADAGDRLIPSGNTAAPDRVMVTLPNGVQAEFSRPHPPAPPVRRDQVPWLRDVKVVNWVADDPNGDQLEFDLFARGEEEKRWRLLAGEVSQQTHAFETAGLPDGHYRLKVIASDRRSNPLSSALSDSLESTPFMVDNTAPQIRNLRVAREETEERLTVTAAVVDELSPIRIFEYSLDARAWEPVFPEDGLFDAREEHFRFTIDVATALQWKHVHEEASRTAGAAASELLANQTVFVRSADASGNEGAARAVAP